MNNLEAAKKQMITQIIKRLDFEEDTGFPVPKNGHIEDLARNRIYGILSELDYNINLLPKDKEEFEYVDSVVAKEMSLVVTFINDSRGYTLNMVHFCLDQDAPRESDLKWIVPFHLNKEKLRAELQKLDIDQKYFIHNKIAGSIF